VLGVEGRVVLGEVRVVAVAKDGLYKVEVADHGARGDEAHLVGLLLGEALDLGAGEGAEEERAVDLCLLLRVGSVGERHQLRGRVESRLEDPEESGLGHSLLLVRDGEAAVRDVEHARGGALVVLGVVQNALGDAVRGDDVVLEKVLALGERQHLGEAVAVELELPGGELGDLLAHVLEVVVEEVLDALIRGAQRKTVVVEEVLLLLVRLEDGLDQAHEVLLLALHLGHGDAARGKLEVDISGEEGVVELAGGATRVADALHLLAELKVAGGQVLGRGGLAEGGALKRLGQHPGDLEGIGTLEGRLGAAEVGDLLATTTDSQEGSGSP